MTMLAQIEARLAKIKETMEMADKIGEESSGASGKTVGVKVDDGLYSMLRDVQENRGLKSIKASLILCASVGAKMLLGRT